MTPGTVLHGRYEIEAVSGRGGFGATYRVRDRERFGHVCALKELLPNQAENPKARELFEREARTLLSLRHPGIPALHAFFVHEDRYYLVEDFVEGRTLAREMEEQGRFAEAQVVAVLDEALAILEYLHGRTPPVIHRDIKAANIIRADTGRLYLIDFGTVKEAMDVTRLSAESTIIGTSGYTPPEQLRGVVVPASDLYALGAMALHLLTGRAPGEWFNAMDGAWRFAGQLGVSRRFEEILGRLLEEQLARRYQSATEVREALRGVASPEQPSMAATQLEPRVPVGSPARSRRWLVGGSLAVVVVAVTAVAAFMTLRPGADPPAPVTPPAVPTTSTPPARTPREPDRAAGRAEPRSPTAASDARRPSAPVEARPRTPEPARAAVPSQPVSALPHRVFRAPVDRVWSATERALKGLGWDLDKRDQDAGLLITESRRLEGEDFGVYAKDLRHRLRVQVRPAGQGQTLVTVERLVFRRERVLWANTDEPVDVPASQRNQQTEQGVLAAIGRSL